MGNRICLVLPFFTGGEDMPSYSNLFFETIGRNKDIDLLLLTDCGWYRSKSDNVTLVSCTLADVKERAQTLFDFDITLDTPYKLCDYRPFYGLIFEDYLKGYGFWGNCDMDMAFGDAGSFLTDSLLDGYDKIYQHGHLTLYKNTDAVNTECMSDYGMDYRHVLTTPVSCVFDEIDGIQRKFDHDGFKTYKGFDFLDINPWRWHLSRTFSGVPDDMREPGSGFDFEHECFAWEDGRLFRYVPAPGGGTSREEFLYFHFQKRDFATPQDVIDTGRFYLTNDGCLAKDGETGAEDIDRYNRLSSVRDLGAAARKERFIWERRFNKYALHK